MLGTTAALLHVWNHAAMKGLMFFAAGSVVHATGTRDMERLGGLMKRMPWTGAVVMAWGLSRSPLCRPSMASPENGSCIWDSRSGG